MTDTINTLADPGSDPAHEWRRDGRVAAKTIRVTTSVHVDDVRDWAEKHLRAGHHGIANLLFDAAERLSLGTHPLISADGDQP
ncbi:hypothetical protein [Prescottella equi]|uniref:hypothetical protein n=1 Tax=Rhodococcus hoagii TaxID=43767 RepID=UPI00113001C3|nr:hypothetical protein [Prescottella equi]